MIYGYARVSTDGQSEAAQVRQRRAARAKKVFREVASGAKTDRAQLRRLLAEIDPGDVVTVTRLDRLARSTRDLLNTLAAITQEGRFQISWRHMGRHHHIARAIDPDRTGRAGGVRVRSDPRTGALADIFAR
ncbi:MAG TPA: recombinase family protein [Bryobacteraceae bacterium]|nr:recombinase family protein [Bryobacteraceae bacterium]